MCDCIERINARLKERNTELSTCFSLDRPQMAHELLIATNKIDKSKKGRPILATASYCPFCGEDWRNHAERTD